MDSTLALVDDRIVETNDEIRQADTKMKGLTVKAHKLNSKTYF